jgi:hypothetical protein
MQYRYLPLSLSGPWGVVDVTCLTILISLEQLSSLASPLPSQDPRWKQILQCLMAQSHGFEAERRRLQKPFVSFDREIQGVHLPQGVSDVYSDQLKKRQLSDVYGLAFLVSLLLYERVEVFWFYGEYSLIKTKKKNCQESGVRKVGTN